MDERVQQQLIDDVQRLPAGRHTYRLTWTDKNDRKHTNVLIAIKNQDGSVYVDRSRWGKLFRSLFVGAVVTSVVLIAAMIADILTPVGLGVFTTIQSVAAAYLLYATGVSALFHDHTYIG